jgi:hypothetical protein
MISVRQFSILFQNFWHPFSPGLRDLAKTLQAQVYQYAEPVSQQYAPSKRALSSELGFRAFCLRRQNGAGNLSIEEAISRCEAATSSYIARFRRSDGDPEFIVSDVATVDDEVRRDAQIQCRQLDLFCSTLPKYSIIKIEPIIPGCGIIDNCRGDLMVNDDLYESKSRVGQIEQSDIRQLLTYAILLSIASPERVSGIGILNPFRGTRSILEISDAVHIVSGCSLLEFCAMTADALTAERNSR